MMPENPSDSASVASSYRTDSGVSMHNLSRARLMRWCTVTHRRLAITGAALAGAAALVVAVALISADHTYLYEGAVNAAGGNPIPLPGCDSLKVPTGQANPPGEMEPMSAIWCFQL